MAAANRTHGATRTRTWNIWAAMRKRCANPNDTNYPRYGGKGIRVCEAWATYQQFVADMGEVPEGMSIERINNAGDYTPENCRWATKKEQANNRTTNRWITARGETLTLKQWSERTGIHAQTLLHRLTRGWSDEKTISTPVGSNT